MFEIYLALSDDRTEASVQLPSMGGPQKMSADEFAPDILSVGLIGEVVDPGHTAPSASQVYVRLRGAVLALRLVQFRGVHQTSAIDPTFSAVGEGRFSRKINIITDPDLVWHGYVLLNLTPGCGRHMEEHPPMLQLTATEPAAPAPPPLSGKRPLQCVTNGLQKARWVGG
ncbi:MAG: hypothetical protein WBA40_00810 [Roseiarcus sp.]